MILVFERSEFQVKHLFFFLEITAVRGFNRSALRGFPEAWRRWLRETQGGMPA